MGVSMADQPELEIVSVERFRQHSLVLAGYPEEEAWVIARRHEIDVHQACDLLANGCDFRVALKILL